MCYNLSVFAYKYSLAESNATNLCEGIKVEFIV